MRRYYFITFAVVLVVLFSFSVLADSAIEVTPIKNSVQLNDAAKFGLRITNLEEQSQKYSIYSLQSGQGWTVDPSPFEDRFITIGPKQSYATTIIARPLEDFSPGIYHVNVNIESDLGERYSKSLKMYLSPEQPLDYLPSIKATLDIDEKINPKDPVSVKLFLENKNPLDLTDLKIRIQSDIPEFVKELTVNIPPLERKTVEFTIIPNEFQQPKNYVLFFVFERNGQTVKILDKKIEILPLIPTFMVETSSETIFLKKFTQVNIINEGNVLNKQDVKLPVSFLQALFTSSDGSTVKTEDGQRYLVWEVSLSPGETTSRQVIGNYRLALYILIAVVLFLIFYWYVRSPVIIKKKANTTKGHESGSLSQVKVTLEVRNKSKKPLKDIIVTDLVPTIANVEKSLELGTLKPKEIKHTKQGTKVIWSLAELDSYEHRLITYKVKSKLNILGTFILPRSIVQYKKGKRRIKKAYSNVVRVSN